MATDFMYDMPVLWYVETMQIEILNHR